MSKPCWQCQRQWQSKTKRQKIKQRLFNNVSLPPWVKYLSALRQAGEDLEHPGPAICLCRPLTPLRRFSRENRWSGSSPCQILTPADVAWNIFCLTNRHHYHYYYHHHQSFCYRYSSSPSPPAYIIWETHFSSSLFLSCLFHPSGWHLNLDSTR